MRQVVDYQIGIGGGVCDQKLSSLGYRDESDVLFFRGGYGCVCFNAFAGGRPLLSLGSKPKETNREKREDQTRPRSRHCRCARNRRGDSSVCPAPANRGTHGAYWVKSSSPTRFWGLARVLGTPR